MKLKSTLGAFYAIWPVNGWSLFHSAQGLHGVFLCSCRWADIRVATFPEI